jgi:hypothetical protein
MDVAKPAPPSAPRWGQRGAHYASSPDWVDKSFTALLALFVCFSVLVIYYREDFATFDCDQLTDFAVAGHSLPPIWPSGGRFFPLGLQEFNVLRYVTRTPFGFQSMAVVQLVILVGVLFAVLQECRPAWRSLISVAAVVTPSFVISFMGLIYPERNALFWLAILILCLSAASSQKTPIYFLGCLVSTQFFLYYKEPLVVLILAYAVSRIILNICSNSAVRQNSWPDLLRMNLVPLGLCAVAAIYSLLFLIFMFPFPFQQSIYISNQLNLQHLNKAIVLLQYLQADWIAGLLAVVLFARVLRLAFARLQMEPLWDSLAVAAIAYFAAIVGIGMYQEYYLAPVDLIAVLYLGRLAALWVQQGSAWRTSIIGAAYVCLVTHSGAWSTLLVLDRKERILCEADLSDFLKTYKTANDQRLVEIVFPRASGFRIAEVSAYLKYKGIRLMGQSGVANEPGPEFVMAGTGNYPSGICHTDKPYLCKHEDKPEDRALVVFLPGEPIPQEIQAKTANSKSMIMVSASSWPNDPLTRRGLGVLAFLSGQSGGFRQTQPSWEFYVFKTAAGEKNRSKR